MFNWLQKPLHVLLAGLMLVPLVITFHFYWVEGGNVPYADQWCDAVPMVIEASDGNMQPGRIFAQHNVHRIITASAFTLVNRYLTQWNLKLEIVLNFVLAGINMAVLLWALYRYEKLRGVWLLLAAIFMSALIFTVRARAIWMWSYSAPYIVLYTLALVGAFVLVRFKPGAIPLFTALALNLVAFWSIGSGVVSLLLIPFGLWMLGYRRVWHYAAWVGSVALGFWVFFFQFNRTDPNFCRGYVTSAEGNSQMIENLVNLPAHITRALGGVLVAGNYSDAKYLLPLGLWLVVIFLLNGAYMLWVWWQKRAAKSAFIWLNVLAPALSGVILIGVGRHTSGEALSLYSYFGSNYVYQAAMVLAGVVGLVVVATYIITQKPQAAIWERGLVQVNTLSVVLFVLFNYYAISGSTNLADFPHGELPTLHPSADAELCLRNFFFTDGYQQSPPSCYWNLTLFGDQIATEQEFVDYTARLSELRLTTFAGIQHQLPDTYAVDDPIIVSSSLAAQQFPVVDNAGREIPEERITRVVEDETQVEPLTRQNAVHVQTRVDYVLPRESFWYFTPGNVWPSGHSVDLRHDYIPYLERQPYDLQALFVAPALRDEAERHPTIDYGGELRLYDWQLIGDTQQTACGALDVETWWAYLGDSRPLENYSRDILAVAPDNPGEVLSRLELSTESEIQTEEWRPGTLYYGRHSLDIPCEAAAGEYVLLSMVYDYRVPDAPLTIDDSGNSSAYLTTIFVQDE